MRPPMRSSTRRASDRAGYTLAEMLLAMTLTLLLLGTVVPFLTIQSRNVTTNAGRSDALQNARYAQNTVDRELRNTGIGVMPAAPAFGVPRNQPKIIQADTFSITFNANLITRDSADLAAVYYDPNVDSLLVSAIDPSRRVTLPRSTAQYPDYLYVKNDGSPSGAEMISFWASRDSTSNRGDEYVLWRRVNDGPITVVSTGIRIAPGDALFAYQRVDSSGALVTVPMNQLPIMWNTVGSRADSIRTITMDVRGVFRTYGLRNDTLTIERRIRALTAPLNIGLSAKATCGDVPLPAQSFAATALVDAVTGARYVRLDWLESTDENAGERDVERYALYRKAPFAPTWGDPITSIGKGGRTYDDYSVGSGIWIYGISAQDCSPANSAMSQVNVNVP